MPKKPSLILLLLGFTIGSVFGHSAHLKTEPSLSEDESHIKEHLKDMVGTDANLSADDLEFHYFKLHDTDGNDQLDGLEMLKALLHNGDGLQPEESKPASPIDLTLFTNIIDQVLKNDDVNQDGYLSYEEYKLRMKAS